jgi:Uma2 family endonuclease
MPKNPAHSLATGLLSDLLALQIPAGYFVSAQEPLTLSESEPEPDVMVVHGMRRDYRQRHPGAQDVVLVVEVADSTLARDRNLKKPLYATAGIAHYWILNLQEQQLEVFARPSAGQYLEAAVFKAADRVELTALGLGLLVAEVLPDHADHSA